jgi:iron complex outermembrane recepter protein
MLRTQKWVNGVVVANMALSGLRVSVVDAQTLSADTPQSNPQLQEVIVTATRRSENLSQVPESAAVFDAASLEIRGIRTAADLIAAAPGVDLSTQLGIQTNISIRGISNTAGQIATGAATTAIYLDETPVQVRSMGNGVGDSLPDVFDLDRVEVLRGPQGTLFGSGAEGGAIRFIPVEPDLETSSGFQRAEVGFTKNGGTSYDAGIAQGGPIIDNVLGFRISAHYRHDGGFIDRDPYPVGAGPMPGESNANFSDTTSVRAALLWSPIENLKIEPSVYLRQTDINDTGVYWTMLSNPSATRYVSGNGEASPDTNRSSLGSLKFSWTRDPVDMISTTSYYSRDETNLSDYRALITNTFDPLTGQNPFTVFATPGYYDNGVIDNTQRNWTQELRVQSATSDSRLSWVTGVFYADNRQLNYENNRTPFLDLETGIPDAANYFFGFPLINGQYLYEEQIITHDKQFAGFGEVSLNVTSHLKLTAGLRVARTEIDYVDTRNGPLAGGPGEDSGEHVETPKTPKYVITYQFDSKNMVYGSVVNGFRIGGVNPDVSGGLCAAELESLGYGTSAPKTYNSDRVRNYEIGLKSQPSSDFRVAASVYYIDWFDIIQPVDLVSCGRTFTTNLGMAVSKGADLDVTFAPLEHLLFDLMMNYDDARFTQSIRNPTAQANIVTSGWTLGQTPWTVVGSSELGFNGPFGWDSYFRTDVDYRSKNSGLTTVTDPTSVNYNPLLRPNPSTVDVRLRLGVHVSSWDTSIYINNAINQHPLYNLQNDSAGGAISYATPVRPFTAGITWQRKF